VPQKGSTGSAIEREASYAGSLETQGTARYPVRAKRVGVDDEIAALTEYDPETECLIWTGPMHRTGRYPILDHEDPFAVKTYLFRGLPGAKRRDCITVWSSTCGDRRCVSWLHAYVHSYAPKHRG